MENLIISFKTIANSVFNNDNFTSIEKMILLFIAHMDIHENQSSISYSYIGSKLNLSSTTVRRAISNLSHKNFIRVIANESISEGSMANSYALNHDYFRTRIEEEVVLG